VSGIQDALKAAGISEIHHAFDAVSEHNSFQNISKILAKHGSKITLVLPGADYSDIPDYISHNTTTVGTVHKDVEPDSEEAKAGIRTAGKEFGLMYVLNFFLLVLKEENADMKIFRYFRLFTRGLQEGWFTPHPYTIIPGGLGGVEEGLTNLKTGKVSATKFIFKIEDTK
jgi:NADPH2:quinone reductase